MNRHILSEVIKRAESLSKSIAAVAPYHVLDGDMLGVDNLGWGVKEANSDIEYAVVTDTDLKILAHTDVSKIGQLFPPSFPNIVKESKDGTVIYQGNESGIFEIRTQMMFKNRLIGKVIIGINQTALRNAKSETMKKLIVGLGLTIILGTGCIFILSSLITKPLNELANGVEELKMGRRRKLHMYSGDELGKLTASFNHMTELAGMQQAKLSSYAAELENSYVSTIKVLTAAIDARDPYTLGHSTRVAGLALKMGISIGLSEQELEELEIASLFHDVGKLKTPDYLLLKDGLLDSDERREIAGHCEYGAAILSRASSLLKYIPAVRHHHEWFNGKGYPDGLRGDDIPLHAAIISIADAFDAMTSERPYKSPLSYEEALMELKHFSGSQFNPWLVEVFQSVIDPIRDNNLQPESRSCETLQ